MKSEHARGRLASPLTWREAMVVILRDSMVIGEECLHFREVAERIVERGLRNDKGKSLDTMAVHVNALVSNYVNTIVTDDGLYLIRPKRAHIALSESVPDGFAATQSHRARTTERYSQRTRDDLLTDPRLVAAQDILESLAGLKTAGKGPGSEAVISSAGAAFREAARIASPSLDISADVTKRVSFRREIEFHLAAIVLSLAEFIPSTITRVPSRYIKNARASILLERHGMDDLSVLREQEPQKLRAIPGMSIGSLKSIIAGLIDLAGSDIDFDSAEKSGASCLAGTRVCVSDDLPVDRLDGDVVSVVRDALSAGVEWLDSMDLGAQSLNKERRQLFVLKRRLEGATLNEIGEGLNVSRERVRQIETAAVMRWPSLLLEMESSLHLQTSIPWRDSLADLISRFKSTRRLVTGLAKHHPAPSEMRHYQRLLRPRRDLSGVTLGTVGRLLALRSEDSLTFYDVGRGPNAPEFPGQLLVPMFGPTLDEAEFSSAVWGLLESHAFNASSAVRHPLFVDLVSMQGMTTGMAWILVDWLFRFALREDDGVVAPIWFSEVKWRSHRIREVFRNALGPVDLVSDILENPKINQKGLPATRTMSAARWVSMAFRSLDHEDKNVPWIVGNSCMVNRRMMAMTVNEARHVAREINALLAREPARQFSAREIHHYLRGSNLISRMIYWPEHWPGAPRCVCENLVQVVMNVARPVTCRYLGRFVWTHGEWTDEPDVDERINIQSFIKDLIEEAGVPLSSEEITFRLNETRGVGRRSGSKAMQILEKDGVYRVAGHGKSSLYWDSDLGSPPLDAIDRGE